MVSVADNVCILAAAAITSCFAFPTAAITSCCAPPAPLHSFDYILLCSSHSFDVGLVTVTCENSGNAEIALPFAGTT